MDLRLLTRFIAIAELGSLNKAAQRLNLSQPALSKSIQLIEQRFSVAVLDRGPGGVSLTDFGRTLFTHAKRLEAEMRNLDAEITAMRSLEAGEVNAGVPLGPGFISGVLASATLTLVGRGRRLSINYTTGSRENLVRPLLLGDLDFIVTVMADDAFAAELIEEELYVDQLIFVGDCRHPLAGQADLGLAELTFYPWVVLAEDANAEATLRKMARSGGPTVDRSVLRSNSSLFIKSILTRSAFVGLVRQDTVRAELAEGTLVELSLQPTLRSADLLTRNRVGLATRPNSSLSTAGAALLAEIKRECAALAR